MSENTILGKDENIILKHDFMYSLAYFFIKSDMTLTSKRVICEVPNLLAFIPVGKNNVTYPLNSIAAVTLDTRLSFKALFIGMLLTLIGLSTFNYLFLLFFAGLFICLSSYKTTIVIQNSGGSSMPYLVSPLERAKAKDFINQVNITLADRT
jgi:hypothetical protein